MSNADRAAQSSILEQINFEFPEETIVAEEDNQPAKVPPTNTAWIVYTIDGTANFIRGLSVWSTTVGLVKDNEPIGGVTVIPGIRDEYVANQSDTFRNDG